MTDMNSENTIVIDDRRCSFQQGETILQVAQRNGIHIPTLCHLKGASPTGACRICLVEVEKARNLVASCAAPAVNDMIVKTGTPRVVKVRNMNIEFLLA
jgi:NADH dehydrogenase/NADH:ubiquinone oxidoreductase subunit G